MTNGIGKTNANEKTTKSDMRDAPGVSLFPNAPMPGHKSSEEEARVGNGLGLCTHGAVERLPLLNLKEQWHYQKRQ